MHIDEKNALKRDLDAKKQLDKLLKQEEFVNIFLKKFLKESLHEMIYREGSTPGVIKQMDARKVFNDFIYQIIEDGKKAEEALS